MTEQTDTDAERAGGHKADFSTIYDLEYPRSYYELLTPLDYQIPQNALPFVQAVHAAAGGDRTVLDVCCSYGINGALLRHDVDLAAVAVRCADPSRSGPPGELVEQDARFFAERRHEPGVPVLGLDIAPRAIDYGIRTGLLTGGWAEDLESSDPSPELATALAGVGMVVCTGGVGYVGHRTFDRLLDSMREPADLWAVVFVLRVFPYDDIVDSFERHGLVTEQVPGATVRQRRFADRDEQEAAVRDVERRGLDPAGREEAGWYYADCYLTRPAAAAAAQSATDLLAGVLD